MIVEHYVFAFRLTKTQPTSELADENHSELLNKHYIDNEIDAGVEKDEKVRRFRQSIVVNVIKCLEHVCDDSWEVAAQEDDHDAKQHRRQFDVLNLLTCQFNPHAVHDSHLMVDHQIEESDAGQRNEVHEDEVTPVDVDRDVSFVDSQWRCADIIKRSVIFVLCVLQ